MVAETKHRLSDMAQHAPLQHGYDWVVSACTEAGLPVPVRVCEAGATEFRLQTNRPIEFGTLLRLSVCTSFHSRVAVTEAVVHHCQPADSGWWVGVFLRQCLPEFLLTDSSAEHRSEIRYEANWRIWLRPVDSTELIAAVIENYSLSGISLLLPEAVDTDQTLELLATPAPEETPVLRVRIQWCRRIGDRSYRLCGRIPDHSGRSIPVAFHSRSGHPIASCPAAEYLSQPDLRPNRLQFAIPDAEFSAGNVP